MFSITYLKIIQALLLHDWYYLELQRQDALENTTEHDAHFTLGDLQRQHQRMAQRSTIALVFSLTQQGLGLDDIYERLAA